MTSSLRRTIFASAASIGFVLSPASAQETDTPLVQPEESFQCNTPDLSQLSLPDRMEILMPANVFIETSVAQEAPQSNESPTGPFEQMPEMPPANALGSGFIIDPSGLILTNNHVVEGATEINVILYDPTTTDNIGESHTATLVGRDSLLDLAVLKIDTGSDLPCVVLADSNTVRRGDTVHAIGNPLGQAFSLSSGLISHPERMMRGQPLFDYFQTDAAINRGNSGGGLYNEAGGVIGINTAILSPSGGSIGVGFAIQSNDIREVADEIIQAGSAQRAGLGVSIAEIPSEEAQARGIENGVLVNGTAPGKAADLAGIVPGDVILEVNGVPMNDSRELSRLIASYEPGDHVSIKILRENALLVLEVELMERGDATKDLTPPDQQPAPPSPEMEEGPSSMEEFFRDMFRGFPHERFPENENPPPLPDPY